ncbi:hypothetical protein [Shewanella baltica]|uniref:ParM/StbA family protein n=1 Tax=Shewanella baltica TaxID=62322 RepID=UPI0039AE9CDE
MINPVIVTVDVGYGTTTCVHKESIGSYAVKTFPSLPIPVKSEVNLGLAGEERDVTNVEVDGITYEVGNDVGTSIGSRNVRVLNTESFITSDRYKALLFGALSFLGKSNHIDIDVLVLGLPVSVMFRKEELSKIYTGTHQITSKRKVTIRQVLVYEQPLGALMTYLRQGGNERFAQCKDKTILSIDPGYMTTDFITSKGIKVNPNRSDDSETGMSKVIAAVEVALRSQLESFNLKQINPELIDQAFITRKLKLYGKSMDFPKCDLFDVTSAIRSVCDEAITSVVNKVGDGQDIDLIIVSGGAAEVYLPSIKRAFPFHTIEVVDDSLTAVARGLQTAGEQFIRGAIARGDYQKLQAM